MGCFVSFQQKPWLLCDGGLISVKNKKKYEFLLKLRTHGGTTRNQHDVIGYNSRLDEIQAAVLDTKLKYVKSFIKKRIKIADFYYKGIVNDKLRLPFKSPINSYV